jgi:hypothetical protein
LIITLFIYVSLRRQALRTARRLKFHIIIAEQLIALAIRKKVLEPSYVECFKSIEAKPEVMNFFEKIVFDKFKEKTAEIANQNERLKKSIAELEKEKVNTISLIAEKIISKEDGKLAIDKINEKIQENKGFLEVEERPQSFLFKRSFA